MIIDSKEFIESAYKLGCTKQDFESCADRITERTEAVQQLLQHGYGIYFLFDRFNGHLLIVTSPAILVSRNDREYADLFSVIRYLAH